MAQDFGPNWESVESEDEGGQAHIFTATRVGDKSGKRYVIKRLKNLDRLERFERELDTIKRLAHPNIVALVDTGVDKKDRPFIVTELCEGRSLAKSEVFDSITDLQKLAIFCQICRAVEYAHSEGVIHRDIKPENIFLRDIDNPVLGDFGICYVEENGQLTVTEEVMGSRHYCAPELRDGRIRPDIAKELADIYSLGKLLYWMFTKRVFDREETYANNQLAIGLATSDTVVRPVQSMMAAATVDDLVSESVVGDPSRRVIRAAKQLRAKVERAIDRIKVLGRPIDLSLPKRCLFCGEGEYMPLHERTEKPVYGPPFPSREKRTGANPKPQAIGQSPGLYDRLTSAAVAFVELHPHGWPLYLVCDYCGNVQYFRLDLTKDKRGENWKP